MHPSYILHTCFKILRPVRYKYKLSINPLLTLNAIYLYGKHIEPSFSFTSLSKFITYWPIPKVKSYCLLLLRLEFIIECGKRNKGKLYKLTSKGMTITEEINNSYQIELSKFCNSYNIVL